MHRVHDYLPHFVKVVLNPVMKKRGNAASDPPGPPRSTQDEKRSSGPRQRRR
jgi:hypothetical protein